MNTLEGIYTKDELAKMTATAQHLSNLARDMSNMLIYCDCPEWHAQNHQDGIQAAFSELHSIVLGLEPESLTEAHSGLNGETQ